MQKKYSVALFIILGITSLLLVFKPEHKNTIETTNFEKIVLPIYQQSFTKADASLIKLDSLLANRINNKEEEAHIYFLKGEINILNRQFEEAIANSTIAYNYYKNTDHYYTTGLCLITISSAHAHLTQYQKAQEVAFKALKLAKEQSNIRLLGKVYNRLFNIHIALNDYETGLMYILKTDSLFTIMKDSSSMSACKNNIGAIYMRLNEYNNAISYFEQAVDLMINDTDVRPLVSTYNNLGFTHIMVGDIDNAIFYLKKSITINRTSSTINPAPFKGLGKAYIIQSKIDSSNYYYQKALNIYSSEAEYSEMIEILNQLISNNFIAKNYDTAIAYQKDRDSIQNHSWAKEKEELLSFANVKYEVLKKEQEVEQEAEKNKSNRIIFSIIALTLVLLIFALIVTFNNYRLRTANQTADLEQKLLRIQMNPHFIFNTLAAIQNIILDGDTIKSTKLIAKFSRLMRQIFEYVRKENISLDQEINMLANYIGTQQARFNNKFIYQLELDEKIHPEQVQIPPMLLQPFIENSIEYGLKHLKIPGEIKVSIKKINHHLEFIISDNGIGRSQMKKYKHTENEIHATDVFLSRLKKRHLGEENSFEVIDLFDTGGNASGTIVKFKLRSK
ncbi:tetratricopeptide repeat-containing sensor histidine kinase [Saccharicrinis aurantiacus]|uniref:tetratricopeptide repeat-containing sensor histidine kinase n=1 Tax=Saccharicrinis aurantiacus TaxID=1849719 RepID=UPI00094F8958|nr:histidine kinase [Saccharicrinis aurantiacus]